MPNLCSYSHALGVPGKGVHTHIWGVAVVDLGLTIAFIWIVNYVTKWDFSLVAAITFFVAFLLHRLFCIRKK